MAFSQLFSTCVNGFADYVARRAAIASLREFDDRALRDIGLEPSQIEAAVHGFITLSRTNAVATDLSAYGQPRGSAFRSAS